MQPNDLEDEEPPRDRRFCPYRYPKTDPAKAVVADVLNQLQNYEQYFGLRKRARKQVDQEIFETTVAAIVCDLVHHHLSDVDGSVTITRSNSVLGRKNRYRPIAYGKTLPHILDRLASFEMSFVEQLVGHEGDDNYLGRQTTICAGPRLITRIEDHEVELSDLGEADGEEVIILKRAKKDRWDDGGVPEYRDTPTTRSYREQLHSINSWLRDAIIDFDPDIMDRPVDDGDRRLRRIFTRSSFKSGGRLFGGFWQSLSKKHRQECIYIEGRDIVALDYGQMGPRILYGLAKAAPPHEDAYLLPELEEHRGGVKLIFNSLLFSSKPLTRMPKGVRQAFPKYVSVKEVVRLIHETHPALKKFFHTNIGHRVQFLESETMVALLLALQDQDIVALPIHDAVIVPRPSKTTVIQTMLSIFHQYTGIEGLVTVEGI